MGDTDAAADALHPVTFGPFRLDVRNSSLSRDGARVDLTPKAFAVLQFLAERPGQLVRKSDLLDAVWPDTFVDDAVLKFQISEIRKALSDDPRAPRFIETVHRRGYRFVAAVGAGAPQTADQARAPAALVGRDAEMGSLREAYRRACGGERQIVFVTGEGGIGKTALVDAFDAELRSDSVLRARGQCLEHHGSGEAYLPMLEALGQLCRGPDAPLAIDVLRRLAPTWLVQMPWLIDAEDRDGLQREAAGTTRERMLRELAEALEALTRQRPLVIVLEDLHWSDPSSVNLIGILAHRRDRAGLLLIGTYRPVEVVVSSHPLKGLKQRLEQQRLCAEIRLSCLSRDDVARYLEQRLASEQIPAALADTIAERTDGNALFVVNVIDELLARHWLVRDGARYRLSVAVERVAAAVPPGVRLMIEEQVDRLPRDDAARLEAASVAGEELATAAIAAALAETGDAAETFCEAQDRHGLFLRAHGVSTLPGGEVCGRYRFAHALIRDVLYQRIGVPRRMQLHRRIGEWLETTDAGAAELARHFAAAGAGCVDKAVRYARQAGERASGQFAYAEAADHYRNAIDLLGNDPQTAGQRGDLLIALGQALERSGNVGVAIDQFAAAADIGRAIGAHELFARAVFGMGRGHHIVTQADTRLIGLLEEAVDVIGDSDDRLRACLLARLDTALSPIAGNHGRREQLRRQAQALAQRLDDPEISVWVLQYGRWASSSSETETEMRASVATLAGLADRAVVREHAMHLHLERIAVLNELGDTGAATTALDELNVLADDAAIPWFQWFVLRLRTMMALQAGDFSAAKQLADDAVKIGETTDHPNVWTLFQVHSIMRYLMQGRFAEVEQPLIDFVEANPRQDASRATLAYLYAQTGDLDAARRHFEPLARDGFSGIPHDSVWLISMARLAEVCAALDDAPRAALMLEMVAGYVNRIIGVGPSLTSLGHGHRYLALLAQTVGRWDEAAERFAEVIALHRRMGAQPWLAYTLVDRAGMLVRWPLKGSARAKARRQAAEDLRQASAIAHAIGMQGLERQIAARAVN